MCLRHRHRHDILPLTRSSISIGILTDSAHQHLVPLQERSIYFLAPESDGAVFRLHSNIVVSSLRWRNDLSLSEKTINVSRWGTSAPSTNLDREIPKENVTSWSNGFIGDRNDFRS